MYIVCIFGIMAFIICIFIIYVGNLLLLFFFVKSFLSLLLLFLKHELFSYIVRKIFSKSNYEVLTSSDYT